MAEYFLQAAVQHTQQTFITTKKEVAEGRAAKGMDGGEEIKEGTRDVVIQVWGGGLLVA